MFDLAHGRGRLRRSRNWPPNLLLCMWHYVTLRQVSIIDWLIPINFIYYTGLLCAWYMCWCITPGMHNLFSSMGWLWNDNLLAYNKCASCCLADIRQNMLAFLRVQVVELEGRGLKNGICGSYAFLHPWLNGLKSVHIRVLYSCFTGLLCFAIIFDWCTALHATAPSRYNILMIQHRSLKH